MTNHHHHRKAIVNRNHLIPFGVALCALGLVTAGRASADVRVTVTPDAATSSAGAANGYTITADAPTATPLARFRFLIASHGQPCGSPDETGTPKIGGDADTNFLVTDPAGGVVNGRWITWLGLTAPVTLHISVLMPPLGGCFYSGATADASVPVTGLRRGASVFNDQAQAGLATGGSVHAADATARQVKLAWWMRNGTDQPVTLAAERLGASDGWSLDSWSSPLTTPVRLRKGVIWVWHDQVTIPAHGEVDATALLERPCGAGSGNLRLRVTLPDGTSAGTGNGVNVQLAAC